MELAERVETEIDNARFDADLGPFYIGRALGAILKSDDLAARQAALDRLSGAGFDSFIPKPRLFNKKRKRRSVR